MKKDYSNAWLFSYYNLNWDVIEDVGNLSVYGRLDMPRLRKVSRIYLYAPLYTPELREVGRMSEWGSDEWYAPKLEKLYGQVFESGKCLEF